MAVSTLEHESGFVVADEGELNFCRVLEIKNNVSRGFGLKGLRPEGVRPLPSSFTPSRILHLLIKTNVFSMILVSNSSFSY